MGGSVAGFILSLLVLVIDIYLIMLFVRLFVAEYERYDTVLDMVLQATDPLVVPLHTALRTRTPQLVPLALIVVLLLIKGMLLGSIPTALQGFFSTLLRIYVLTILLTAAFRDAHLNPIVSFGQRMVRPIRQIARSVSPQPALINVLAIAILVVLHTFVLLVLDNIVVGRALIDTLRIIVDLTWFFVIVLFLYVILSWFSPDPSNPLVQLLTLIAVPLLEPLRRVIPPIAGVIDISPILALFALQIANNILHAVLDHL